MAFEVLEKIEFTVTLCPRDDHVDGKPLTKQRIDLITRDFRRKLEAAAEQLGGAWVYLSAGPPVQEHERRR